MSFQFGLEKACPPESFSNAQTQLQLQMQTWKVGEAIFRVQLNWRVMVGSFSFLLIGDPPALSEIEGELFRILEGS